MANIWLSTELIFVFKLKVSFPQQLHLGSQEACFVHKKTSALCTFLDQNKG